MSEVVLAVDVGGTKLLGGLITRDAEVLLEREVAAPRDATGVDPGLHALAGLVGELARAAAEGGHRVLAAGVGVPEYVRDGRIEAAEVLSPGRQPVEVVEELLGVEVAVEADVRCAARAEARARAGSTSMFYVSWGTGLSSALLLEDGRPWPGRRGEALALGEWRVAAAVDPGWSGNLEQYAAGRSLGLRYEAATGRVVDGRGVLSLADDGDEVALRVVETASEALVRALVDVVHLLDPGVVVLGGGLGTSRTRAPQAVLRRLPAMLTRPDPPAVEQAVTGARAGLLGAASLAWELLA